MRELVYHYIAVTKQCSSHDSSGEVHPPMQRDNAEEPQMHDYTAGAKLQAPLMSTKSDMRQRADGSSKSDIAYFLHRLHQ